MVGEPGMGLHFFNFLILGRWCDDKMIIPDNSLVSSETVNGSEEDTDSPVQLFLTSTGENKENGLRPLSELQRQAESQTSGGGVQVDYQLHSVVSHHGATIKRGLFICYVRQQ